MCLAAGTNAGRNSRGSEVRRRLDETKGQRLEVLDDLREVELVASPREAAETKPLEPVMGIQASNAHLDAISLIA